jgi:tRNA A-37 threonylcarbamoyl transferase component Bud32
MRPLYRRTLGVLATASVLAGAGFASFKLEARGHEQARTRAAQLASKGLTGAEETLAGRLRAVEARAAAGASLNPVRALVAEHVDTETLQDAFGTESWWQTYRDEFTVHALIKGSERFDFTPDGVERPLKVPALLSAAQERSMASGLVMAGEVPHLAAVAAVDVPLPGMTERPLLVLARPLTALELDAIAQETRTSLALVDSNGLPLARAGASSGEIHASLPWKGEPITEVRGGWGMARAEVSPGLFLWAWVDSRAEAAQARNGARALMVPVWLSALLAAGTALWLGLRSSREKATAEMLARTTQQLAAVKAELEIVRVSSMSLPAIVEPLCLPEPRTRTEPALSAPVTFGRYELLRPLGEGGMARVYLALARGTGGFERLFVIKRLHEHLSRQPEAVRQFMDEARLGASLVHSNVVPVYDFGQVNGEYYMASEYILGRDMDAVLRRAFERDGYPLEPATVFLVAQEVLKALGYAHTRQDSQGRPLGIVHRDVSPMNIIASARGEVKLLDFGIAKSADRSTRTQAGLVKGNVNFISPEQARGLEVDGRADLFSLGLTLYWCLTGELLYEGQNDFERLLQAAEGPNESHWERIARLPPPAAAILHRALQTHPADRFQTAEEFAMALPPVSAEDAASLGRTMARLFGEELRIEASYRKALAAVNDESPAVLGQIFPA